MATITTTIMVMLLQKWGMASQNWSFLNGSGSTRAATTANTERAEWKIQTDWWNESKFLPGTNPQVSGFWIFFLLIGEANLNCPHFTGEHEPFFRWFESLQNTSVTFISTLNIGMLVYFLCKYMWISRYLCYMDIWAFGVAFVCPTIIFMPGH